MFRRLRTSDMFVSLVQTAQFGEVGVVRGIRRGEAIG